MTNNDAMLVIFRSASRGLAVYELTAADAVDMSQLCDDCQSVGPLFHEGSTGFSISPAIDRLQLRPGRLQLLALLRGNILLFQPLPPPTSHLLYLLDYPKSYPILYY